MNVEKLGSHGMDGATLFSVRIQRLSADCTVLLQCKAPFINTIGKEQLNGVLQMKRGKSQLMTSCEH